MVVFISLFPFRGRGLPPEETTTSGLHQLGVLHGRVLHVVHFFSIGWLTSLPLAFSSNLRGGLEERTSNENIFFPLQFFSQVGHSFFIVSDNDDIPLSVHILKKEQTPEAGDYESCP